MTRSFSVYLDLVRFLAAFLVLLHHARYIYDPGGALFSLGHEAVIVFFVLSGFVIAYVAENKERTLKDYTIARLARLYSVVVPAIVLTGVLDYLGYTLDPAAYPAGAQAWDHIPLRVVGSLLFLNQIWFISMQPFSNVPYWSLGYEAWYYVGFATVAYLGARKGWWLFVLVALFIGPKVVLLMPLWWLGVFLYRTPWLRSIPDAVAWALLGLSVIGIAGYLQGGIGAWGDGITLAIAGPDLTHELVSSKGFLSDYYLGLCIAAHFAAMRVICERYHEVPRAIGVPIRALAGSTFTLYLLHRPLILFYAALFELETVGPGIYIVLLVLIVVTAYVIAQFTEQRKHVLKRWLTSLSGGTGELLVQRFGSHRGLVRLAIANGLWFFGPYRRYGRVDFSKVRRLVFVCQGNVCRSPFAHHLAQQRLTAVPVCSIGLGTGSGHPADALAAEVAADFGVDLSAHRTTAVADFPIQSGDLFLVMEDRHLWQLAPLLYGRDVQVGLLGLWYRPPLALIYDPHRLTRGYFTTCFRRIAGALDGLQRALEQCPTCEAKLSPPLPLAPEAQLAEHAGEVRQERPGVRELKDEPAAGGVQRDGQIGE
jgi:peptidoglycan/LPS O-acetylase OafA/YrhL/protein-tyrosine-phosphatase